MSDHGVLSQIQDGKEGDIAYANRHLGTAQQNYSTIEREALAVVSTIQDLPSIYVASGSICMQIRIPWSTCQSVAGNVATVPVHGQVQDWGKQREC